MYSASVDGSTDPTAVGNIVMSPSKPVTACASCSGTSLEAWSGMKGVMDARILSVTFEGPGTDSGVPLGGVPLDDLQKTFRHLQNAVRMTVQHLSGSPVHRPGRPSNAVREASALRLRGTAPGSLVAELTLPAPAGGPQWAQEIGPRALEAILGFDGDGNGSVPRAAADELRSIGTDLSPEVGAVWLGDSLDRRRVRFECGPRRPRSVGPTEAAVLHGWLKVVNWEQRSAQLHDNVGGRVSLKFDAALDAEMKRLARQYVKVEGAGRFNRQGKWTHVVVDSIRDTRSWDEPFDLRSPAKAPRSAVFDPRAVVTSEEPFDVEDFIAAVHEGRDVSGPRPRGLSL